MRAELRGMKPPFPTVKDASFSVMLNFNVPTSLSHITKNNGQMEDLCHRRNIIFLSRGIMASDTYRFII